MEEMIDVLDEFTGEKTGEVIEVETTNEIAERKLIEVGAITEETYEMLASFKYYQDQYELFKYQLEKAMSENGIKKWDNEYFTATVREDSIQKRVDTERLKEEGIYDKYLKLVPTKGGLTIKFKKGGI